MQAVMPGYLIARKFVMGLMTRQWRDQMQRRAAAILDHRVRLSTENYQSSGTISRVCELRQGKKDDWQ